MNAVSKEPGAVENAVKDPVKQQGKTAADWQRPAPNPALMQQYLREILLSPVYQAAIETPLQAMPKLGQRIGQHVFLSAKTCSPCIPLSCVALFINCIKCVNNSQAPA